MSSSWSERELLVALRAGNEAAAAELEARFRRPLERFAYGYLGRREAVEDVLQEAFCRALASPTLPEELRPWLYRITRNLCLNLVGSSAFRSRGEVDDLDEAQLASQTGHLTKLVREEQRVELARLVRELSGEQQEVLRLRYAEDLSREDIAEVLDLSVSVVKSRLFEGLKKLRALAASLET